MIWKREFTINSINSRKGDNLNKLLDIKFVEKGEDYLIAEMPVDERTIQPAGILHGGASAVLAETVGSVASMFCIPEDENKIPVGIEINANHLRSVLKGGKVIAKGTAVKIGRNLHVWNIEIKDASENLICVSRLTTMIIDKR